MVSSRCCALAQRRGQKRSSAPPSDKNVSRDSHSSAQSCHAGYSSRHEASDFKRAVRGPRLIARLKVNPPILNYATRAGLRRSGSSTYSDLGMLFQEPSDKLSAEV